MTEEALLFLGTCKLVTFRLLHPEYPEIVWNITAIEQDAFRGRFGAPEDFPFSELSDHKNPADKFKHIDWSKVRRFANLRDVPAKCPNWATGGEGPKLTLRLIDLPAIAVIIPVPNSQAFAGFPIDGNHRMIARELLGLKTYPRFVVPPEVEGEYRLKEIS